MVQYVTDVTACKRLKSAPEVEKCKKSVKCVKSEKRPKPKNIALSISETIGLNKTSIAPTVFELEAEPWRLVVEVQTPT